MFAHKKCLLNKKIDESCYTNQRTFLQWFHVTAARANWYHTVSGSESRQSRSLDALIRTNSPRSTRRVRSKHVT